MGKFTPLFVVAVFALFVVLVVRAAREVPPRARCREYSRVRLVRGFPVLERGLECDLRCDRVSP